MEIFDTEQKNKRFKEVASKLLNNCFIIRKREQNDFMFLISNFEKFEEYFDVVGFDIQINKETGVIYLHNPNSAGRQRLGKYESIIILLLRKMYLLKKKELSENTEVRILWEDLAEQYSNLKIEQRPKIDRQLRESTLKLLQRYNLAEIYDKDKMDETQIEIFPSILFALNSSDIDRVYSMTVEKLDSYVGGAIDDQEDND